MEIILLERIEKLGTIGDVVTVKDGYARNYLLPNKKALRANEANRKVFEANRSKIEADNAARRADAEGHAGNVEGKSVVLIRASSNSGQLYGSVSVRDIVDALNADGANVSKSMIVLERPIKTIGVFDVKVALHPEVSVNVKVNVARSPDEADQQAKGVDVIAAMFEDDAAEAAAAATEFEAGNGEEPEAEAPARAAEATDEA
ncbi:50S ribosomal protein L9 [Novosphingobium sp.]|uniref:50S ribosomal protein L9 n=1 Tax=Novosphingobium sp. TaxID=1874826 RepID=UPI0022CC11D3|nr:50S ribosomal protein L9 [Novosphingobium sp.]MCZ8017876.1 50S ribosomal protein L9 [Novosphingobium sp.]MCZ8033600.1 50S ribosomal protein L9 [Novosphingobium sp.]MCZ8050956.1 50S ribosomal protein L9 [Novosphingobium sp.]MCZ8059302.1 50S ribosomal protein L9 [Novosphingobium sp.]MCZ8231140.1 50S ribosomal protein L9 [Novosphingobium sp.]